MRPLLLPTVRRRQSRSIPGVALLIIVLSAPLAIGLVASAGASIPVSARPSTVRAFRAVDNAGDTALRRLLGRQLPALRAADKAAHNGRGGPEAVQAQYNIARDLQEALKFLLPISKGCQRLLAATGRMAAAEVKQAEGFDRLSPGIASAGRRETARAERELGRFSYDCSSGKTVEGRTAKPELDEPHSGEAFPGLLRAHVPAGTTIADIVVNGTVVGQTTPKHGVAKTYLASKYGRWNLSFRFRKSKRIRGVAESGGVWLLPRSAGNHQAPGKDDHKLSAQLALLASGFEGQVGIWVEDLITGASAGWNQDARFPAASTVKLAVLIAALAKFGPRPERSPVAYDLRTMAGWSSNLAANRLLRELGGSEAGGSRLAGDTLARLGANSSTYTGDYRVGTGVGRSGVNAGAPDPPPLVSQRLTTAHDLGRILYLLQAAAMGDDDEALKITRLTRHEARVGLALLLDSQPTSDNLGLFRPNLSRRVPIAQKNGWLNDAQHTAAIIYRESGPTIVVLLTYRPGITRRQAATFGRKVLRLALQAQ